MKTMKGIVLLLIISAMLAGCAARKGSEDFNEFAYGKATSLELSAEKHLMIARGYMARGESEQAFVHLTRAQQKAPSNIDIRALKGELLIEQRQDELALNEFLAVLEANPDHAGANQGAGVIYFRAGLYKEAESKLGLAVIKDPSLWKAHNYLGIIHDRRGEFDEAAAAFSAALGLHQGKDGPAILNNLGVVHMARKDYAQAAMAFKQALQEGGASSRIYNNLGVALAHGGNFAEALEAFRFAGNEYMAHNNLGFVLLSSGRPKMAIPYFEKALELSPSFYTKASENLKRARMASRLATPTPIEGSTPNQLSPEPFPSEGQAVDGTASSVKAVAVPSSAAQFELEIAPVPAVRNPVQKAEEQLENGSGEKIQDCFGIHVSSWRDLDWAVRHSEELKTRGYETWINRIEIEDKGTWHRVLLGRYLTVDKAIEARPSVLEGLGMDHALIYRLQKENLATR